MNELSWLLEPPSILYNEKLDRLIRDLLAEHDRAEEKNKWTNSGINISGIPMMYCSGSFSVNNCYFQNVNPAHYTNGLYERIG